MTDLAHRLSTYLATREPAPRMRAVEVGHALGFDWPGDFIDLMAITEGGEGWIGPSYLVVLSIDEILRYNQGVFAVPGLVRFGSDGGGEDFAFRRSAPWEVVMVDPVAPGDSIIQQGDRDSFLNRLLGNSLFKPLKSNLRRVTSGDAD